MSRLSLLLFRSVGQRSRSKVKPILYMYGKGGHECFTNIYIYHWYCRQARPANVDSENAYLISVGKYACVYTFGYLTFQLIKSIWFMNFVFIKSP